MHAHQPDIHERQIHHFQSLGEGEYFAASIDVAEKTASHLQFVSQIRRNGDRQGSIFRIHGGIIKSI